MILSDFLSRQMIDKSNPHEIIPISFDMKATLIERYYNVGNESKYLVQTCSQAKGRGIKLPEVQGVDNGINPYIKPEGQILKSQNLANKPKIGQGRENLRREVKAPAQVQLQIKEENQTRDQNSIKQKEGLQASLTRQTTIRNIEQEIENDTVPKHSSKPTVTEIKNSYLPRPINEITTQTTRHKDTR